MNRKVIVTLIVFMVLVMTSLILVQTNSLKKAFEIREEQFDQTVTRALKRVIDRLENDEALRILNGTIRSGRQQGEFFPNIAANRNNLTRRQSQSDINISFRF